MVFCFMDVPEYIQLIPYFCIFGSFQFLLLWKMAQRTIWVHLLTQLKGSHFLLSFLATPQPSILGPSFWGQSPMYHLIFHKYASWPSLSLEGRPFPFPERTYPGFPTTGFVPCGQQRVPPPFSSSGGSFLSSYLVQLFVSLRNPIWSYSPLCMKVSRDERSPKSRFWILAWPLSLHLQLLFLWLFFVEDPDTVAWRGSSGSFVLTWTTDFLEQAYS